jgi:hypothetical protein
MRVLADRLGVAQADCRSDAPSDTPDAGWGDVARCPRPARRAPAPDRGGAPRGPADRRGAVRVRPVLALRVCRAARCRCAYARHRSHTRRLRHRSRAHPRRRHAGTSPSEADGDSAPSPTAQSWPPTRSSAPAPVRHRVRQHRHESYAHLPRYGPTRPIPDASLVFPAGLRAPTCGSGRRRVTVSASDAPPRSTVAPDTSHWTTVSGAPHAPADRPSQHGLAEVGLERVAVGFADGSLRRRYQIDEVVAHGLLDAGARVVVAGVAVPVESEQDGVAEPACSELRVGEPGPGIIPFADDEDRVRGPTA